MNAILGWVGRRARALMLVGGGIAACGAAQAATYNIQLKPQGSATPLTCASGGFTFNKSTAGTFATTSPSVVLSGCGATFIPSIANGTYGPGPGGLNVVVEPVTINSQPQGPNVEGLSGTMVLSTTAPGNCEGTGNSAVQKTYTISFAYASTSPTPNPTGRTYTLTCAGPGSFTTRSGLYHVVNVVNAVPEPGAMWLVIAALGTLLVAGRRCVRS